MDKKAGYKENVVPKAGLEPAQKSKRKKYLE